MQVVIILAAIYIIVMPIIFRLISALHKKVVINRKAEKIGRNNAAALKNLPKPLWSIWKPRIAFTIKDKRDVAFGSKKKKGKEPSGIKIQNRQMFFLIWAAGLLAVCIGAFIMNFYIIGAGYITFFFAMSFGISASKKILEKRKQLYTKMYEIGKAKLGLSAEYEENPQAIIQVLEWNENNPVKPQKVKYQIPTNFAAEGEEGFLRQYNQILGTETTWVPSDEEGEREGEKVMIPGWNYEDGEATFYAVPPLPQRAAWKEHYVLGDGIAWSFFPIALGVENGVELTNPETGEPENVLGFDLSGLQLDEAKKFGLKVGGEITTSPMCLTGDTIILTENGPMSIASIANTNLPIFVKSMNSKKEFVWAKMFGTKMTRQNTEIVELTFDNGSTIRCTPDHEWLLSYGTYVQAKDSLHLYIKSYQQEDLQVVDVKNVGYADVFDGEVEKMHNFVVLTDENSEKGLVTSNCFVGGGTGGGKSLASKTFVDVVRTAGENA